MLISLAAAGQSLPAARLQDFLKAHQVPTADFLAGDWCYDDNVYIFFKAEGETPTKETADRDLELMTVRPDNCELVFLDERTCTFRVGNKKFKLDWRLDPQTREFRARVAFFAIKGYLVQVGDRIALIYSKSNLEMMMRFLCPGATHKYINDLTSEMAGTDGLTLGILFSKQ